MLRRTHPRFFFSLALLVLSLVTLPYLFAWRAGGEEHLFTGLLFNPVDGASYLAKMQQGWQGAWRYRLAFTAEPGRGAYLFLYYLFLGHVARGVGAPLILVYHAARLGGAALLLYALDAFYAAHLPRRARKAAFALAALGSGMGWLALPWGVVTTDFSVPEAYPFLSAYVNPHFPLSLALVLLLLIPEGERNLRRGAGAFLLALVSPFGVVLVLLIRGGLALWRLRVPEGRASWRDEFRALLPLAAGGLPYLFYTQWVVRADPVLAAWNAQNLTPAAPWWDVLLAFSPLLPLAVWSVRRGASPAALWLWVGSALALLYAPIALQRRFLFGLYVPLAGLAGLALSSWEGRRARLAASLVAALVAPVNLLVLLTVLAFPAAPPPEVYLSRGEAEALRWISAHTPQEAVFLASPQMGAFIPAFGGRRVVYGHPFETAHASAAEAAVADYFAGRVRPADEPFLTPADYLFFGPRERALGGLPPDSKPIYRAAGVGIWPLERPTIPSSLP